MLGSLTFWEHINAGLKHNSAWSLDFGQLCSYEGMFLQWAMIGYLISSRLLLQVCFGCKHISRDGCSTMPIARINPSMKAKSNLPTTTKFTILLPLLDFCHGLDIQRLYQWASRCWEVAGFQECTCTTREFVDSFAEEGWLQQQFVGLWLCQHAGGYHKEFFGRYQEAMASRQNHGKSCWRRKRVQGKQDSEKPSKLGECCCLHDRSWDPATYDWRDYQSSTLDCAKAEVVGIDFHQRRYQKVLCGLASATYVVAWDADARWWLHLHAGYTIHQLVSSQQNSIQSCTSEGLPRAAHRPWTRLVIESLWWRKAKSQNFPSTPRDCQSGMCQKHKLEFEQEFQDKIAREAIFFSSWIPSWLHAGFERFGTQALGRAFSFFCPRHEADLLQPAGQSKESIAIQCECIGHHEREATDGPGILTSKKGIGIDQWAWKEWQAFGPRECEPRKNNEESNDVTMDDCQAKTQKKGLENYEKEAMEILLKRPASAKMSAPQTSMKRPAAKPASGENKGSSTSKSSVSKKKMLGCIRCRGSAAGCEKCRNPTFKGQRFNGRADYLKWKKDLAKKGKIYK